MASKPWFRGDAGERGKIGDHGQDGRQGIQGERGPGLTQSQVEAEADRIEDVRKALAVALGEEKTKRDEDVDKHFKVIDRKVIVTACFVLFFLVIFMFVDERAERREQLADREFERKIAVLCQQDNEDSERFNAFLERTARAVETNPARSPADRVKQAAEFRGLRQTIAECPPKER